MRSLLKDPAFNPAIFSHVRIRETAFRTLFSSLMIGVIAASSTTYMRLLSSEISH
jgi:hypothetical protein